MGLFNENKNALMVSIDNSENILKKSREALNQAASGTRVAVLDLISDLKNTIEGREKKYQVLVENIQDGMYILRDKKFIFANKALCDMIGLPRSKIIGRTLSELVILDESFINFIARNGNGHREYTIKYSVKETGKKKIVTVWETLGYDHELAVEMGCADTDAVDHKCVFAIGTVKDVTEAVEKERMLKAFSSVINDSSDLIIIVSHPGSILFVNNAFEKIYGYTLQEVVGENPRILKSGIHGEEFYKRMWNTLLCGQEWRGIVFNKSKDGRIIEDDTKIFPFMNGSNTPMFFMAVKKVRRIYDANEADLIIQWHQRDIDKP